MEIKYWAGYNELAWTEPLLAPPQAYAGTTEGYCRLIRRHSAHPVETLLHVASGAGIQDYTFKKHFRVTGVDISPAMMELARELNPEVTYHPGDMRTFDLQQTFDAVAIPDSIGYMTDEPDLRRALANACRHLKSGGVLLVTAHTREEFEPNNFVYQGAEGDTEVTVFENNYIPDPAGHTYEATMVYLIRRRGELEMVADRHIIGVFPRRLWLDIFRELGLSLQETQQDLYYHDFLLGEGKHPLAVFVCRKE